MKEILEGILELLESEYDTYTQLGCGKRIDESCNYKSCDSYYKCSQMQEKLEKVNKLQELLDEK